MERKPPAQATRSAFHAHNIEGIPASRSQKNPHQKKNISIAHWHVLYHTPRRCQMHWVMHKALVSELKPTFHKSCSFGNVVQQLVEDGSDGLFSQHEVLQWRDGSFCHAATATKVTRKWPQRSAHPSTCRHRHLTPGHSKEVTNKPERLRTPGRLV